MIIYTQNGSIIGTFDFNDKSWTGTAAKKIWNKYLLISRENKRAAEFFIDTMKYGGHHSGFFSSEHTLQRKIVD